ncbi:MAG: aminotransferase class V-fold PLP-dependent enzyme [Bacteroidetes bacterium]|jgi:selenocysteine lyase/cysteine desulfurase|nr:MAG: aminotransferase class V-fold PLP-dependent enzyme [Bacteroidota bacterium]
MKKRDFIRNLGYAALAAPMVASAWEPLSETLREPYPEGEDDFWDRIRKDYRLNPDYINLENGYYNIIPTPTLQKFMEHVSEVNYQGSYYMRTVQWDNKKRIADRLAAMLNCPEGTLILTRNTTESLDLIIGGYPWKQGDEAIFALQDYGAMKDHFEQISGRYGVVCRTVSVPNHPQSDEELVSLYEAQITPRTRLIMICHMINITGQILPVRKICDMAHKHGVEVLVDGAHCIGHIPVDIEELNCDYYGSSLHKWLSTPLGAGMLYVRSEHISKIWPLLAEHKRDPDDISRLNHIGTHPVHTDLAVANAMDYLEMIGLERKTQRLRHLQRYWSDPLREVPNVMVNTPADPVRSCGIANVGISGMKPKRMAEVLMEEFGIFTVAIDYANVQGCRITPNVYTTTEELDRFVAAVKTLAARS